MPSKQEIAIVMESIILLADAIKEAGSIPSGHLYAAVMSVMPFSTYEKIIGLLKKANLVVETANVLIWQGKT